MSHTNLSRIANPWFALVTLRIDEVEKYNARSTTLDFDFRPENNTSATDYESRSATNWQRERDSRANL